MIINLDLIFIEELERTRKRITVANNAVTDARYSLRAHEMLPQTQAKLERISAELIEIMETVGKRKRLSERFIESDIEAARR